MFLVHILETIWKYFDFREAFQHFTSKNIPIFRKEWIKTDHFSYYTSQQNKDTFFTSNKLYYGKTFQIDLRPTNECFQSLKRARNTVSRSSRLRDIHQGIVCEYILLIVTNENWSNYLKWCVLLFFLLLFQKSGLTLTLNDHKMGKQTLKILHQLLQDLTCVWPFYGHKAL